MVTLNPRTAALLLRLQTAPRGSGIVRVVPHAGTFVISAAPPAHDDEVLYHTGAPVLYLSAAAASALAGCTLTTRNLPAGPVLAIIAPTSPAMTPSGRRVRRTHTVSTLALLPGSARPEDLRAPVSQRVTEDTAGSLPAEARIYCDACQQPRPARGSLQGDRYLLCTRCVSEHAVARAHGKCLTTGQFVRDKAFGEAERYTLPADPPQRQAAPIRLRIPPAVRGRDDRGNAAPRIVIRLPRRSPRPRMT